MPIDPYANQMQVMQQQGMPVQTFGGGGGGGAGGPVNLPQPGQFGGGGALQGLPNPAGNNIFSGSGGGGNRLASGLAPSRALIANAIMGKLNFDPNAFRDARMDWRAARPEVSRVAGQPNTPIDPAAFAAWRAARPDRQSFITQTPAPNPAG